MSLLCSCSLHTKGSKPKHSDIGTPPTSWSEPLPMPPEADQGAEKKYEIIDPVTDSRKDAEMTSFGKVTSTALIAFVAVSGCSHHQPPAQKSNDQNEISAKDGASSKNDAPDDDRLTASEARKLSSKEIQDKIDENNDEIAASREEIGMLKKLQIEEKQKWCDFWAYLILGVAVIATVVSFVVPLAWPTARFLVFPLRVAGCVLGGVCLSLFFIAGVLPYVGWIVAVCGVLAVLYGLHVLLTQHGIHLDTLRAEFDSKLKDVAKTTTPLIVIALALSLSGCCSGWVRWHPPFKPQSMVTIEPPEARTARKYEPK